MGRSGKAQPTFTFPLTKLVMSSLLSKTDKVCSRFCSSQSQCRLISSNVAPGFEQTETHQGKEGIYFFKIYLLIIRKYTAAVFRQLKHELIFQLLPYISLCVFYFMGNKSAVEQAPSLKPESPPAASTYRH